MAWRSKIRPASFKGVPFGVASDSKESGRRTVVHEFPQRQDGFVEDLGGAATRFTVQAFVIGPDYMARRDALERVLNEPGPGTLVHPWYGEVTVSQFAPYKVAHSAQDGGMATFTLSFARDAQPGSPSPAVNPVLNALEKAGLSGVLSCDAFDAAFEIAGQTAWVVEQAYESVVAAVQRVQRIMDGDIYEISGLLGAVTGYDFLPWVSVGQNLWGVFQGIGASQVASGKGRAEVAARWMQVAAREETTPIVEHPGSTRERVAANESAVNSFTRHIAVVEAARSLAVAVPESRTQASELRDAFVDAMDKVVLEEGGVSGTGQDGLFLPPAQLPDELYDSFTDTRATCLAALAASARTAPEVVPFTPVASLPALALCYAQTGNILLEPDLVVRNKIIHPGFVPASPLEILKYE